MPHPTCTQTIHRLTRLSCSSKTTDVVTGRRPLRAPCSLWIHFQRTRPSFLASSTSSATDMTHLSFACRTALATERWVLRNARQLLTLSSYSRRWWQMFSRIKGFNADWLSTNQSGCRRHPKKRISSGRSHWLLYKRSFVFIVTISIQGPARNKNLLQLSRILFEGVHTSKLM